MGDADSQIMVPVQEIEALMDDAFSELDDGLTSMLSIINILNERTAGMMREMKSGQKFRRCFMAFNVFVLPIVLSIWIACGTTEETNPSYQAALQTAVLLLMFVSGAVGFPFYVYTALELYFLDSNSDEDLSRSKTGTDTTSEDEVGCLSTVEDSLERFPDFCHLINRRILENVRQDLVRRANRVEEAEIPSDRISLNSGSEMFETYNNAETLPSGHQLENLNSRGVRSDSMQQEEGDVYGVKITIFNQTPGLDVEIEKGEERHQPDIVAFGDDVSQGQLQQRYTFGL